MREGIASILWTVFLICFVVALGAWFGGRPSAPVHWAWRIGPSLGVVGILALQLWWRFRPDRAPDLLRDFEKKPYECNGVCFALRLEACDGVAILEVLFQNRYERTGELDVNLRSVRGPTFDHATDGVLALRIPCEGGAFGLAQCPVGIPLKDQGKPKMFDLEAAIRYPTGRGQMMRFTPGVSVTSRAQRQAFGALLSLLSGPVIGLISTAVSTRRFRMTLPRGVAERVESAQPSVEVLWKLGDDPPRFGATDHGALSGWITAVTPANEERPTGSTPAAAPACFGFDARADVTRGLEPERTMTGRRVPCASRMKRTLIIIGVLSVMCAAGLFNWRSNSASWDVSRFPSPWGDGQSIYGHVRSHVDPTGGLLPGGEKLPDTSRISTGSQVRWAPGAMDGVLSHHMSPSDQKKAVQGALRRLEAVLKRPDEARLTAFYRGLLENSALSYIDPLLEAIVERGTPSWDRVHDLARWIATNAPDREPVKLAIALLAISGSEEDADLFLTLGRHDEFTLYAAVAIANSQPNAEQVLWQLAKNVDGWGRIHIVERLGETQQPEIKNWLLREGYKNSIMYEYTAFTCARTGDLVTALAADDIDCELFDGAGEIIQTLIDGQGGPAQGIDDYTNAPTVVARYLDHALRRDPDLRHIVYVNAIRLFLQNEDADWTADARTRWQDRRERLATACSEFIERPAWAERVNRALAEAEGQDFHVAAEAAGIIGIDPWEAYFNRLQRGGDHWYFVMQTNDPDRIDRVVRHALTAIDLDAIATGPADEMGMGPQWAEHSKLDFVLQDLRRFPGKGWPLIEAGLKSPVVRNRNMALRAITAWDRATWTKEIHDALGAAADAEPSDDVREFIRKVRAGEVGAS